MSKDETTTSPLCGTHCDDPLWCIQRKMCKRDGVVDFQAERSETTGYVVYNPRGIELMICLSREVADAITDRTYGCYWRELPIATTPDDLDRFRKSA